MSRTTSNVTLPQQAANQLPQKATDHLPPTLQPPGPNIVWANPTEVHNTLSNPEILQGHAGHADVFVFDVGAEIAHGVGVGGEQYTELQGFDPGLDTIAFIDLLPGVKVEQSISAENLGLGDPAVPDTLEKIYYGSGGEWSHNLMLADNNGNGGSMSFALDHTVNLIDGTTITVPADPWLIA
ncbi:hypothetical protein [Bradyrhizobium sp. Gha]|uniref:hypothetical protein n=1 Tax=Bradyrhizobium sp. Gha TaxID=1855318 RepID=UPI0008EA88EE|nr:hypothetical protein [Bradyrhizobium sp. Gha]SFJ72424.1 hypothetical protein SAMN05216525_13344 [Bradyrhizobium sp. Gha]